MTAEPLPSSPFDTDEVLTKKKHPVDPDISYDSIHHTLGKGATQAAPGNHKHDVSDITTADGGDGLGGSGSAALDDLFVNAAGDTMTGRLALVNTPDVPQTPASVNSSLVIGRDVYPMFSLYKVQSAVDTGVWNIYISAPANDPTPTLTIAPVAYATGAALKYFRFFLDGRMTIGADPINPLDVATKAYVDSKLAVLKAELLGKELPSETE